MAMAMECENVLLVDVRRFYCVFLNDRKIRSVANLRTVKLIYAFRIIQYLTAVFLPKMRHRKRLMIIFCFYYDIFDEEPNDN